VGASGADPHAATPDADRQYLAELQAESAQAQSAPAGGAGGGFQFDPEQIDAQIKQCQQLMTELEQDRTDADTAAQAATPPAEDQDGSQMQASAVRKSFSTLATRIDDQIKYLRGWLDRLNTAKQTYMEQEHVTADQWDRLSKGLNA
jgi:hypothetical protein